MAAQLVEEAKAGKSEEAKDTESKWFKNADDIADALSKLNPNWPKAVLENMLDDHLELTLREANNIISGNAQESVDDYDRIHAQALDMADALSNGIVKQFPDKF